MAESVGIPSHRICKLRQKAQKTPWQKYKPKYMAKFQQKLISLEGRGVEYNGYF